jgi:hypothetical protein
MHQAAAFYAQKMRIFPATADPVASITKISSFMLDNKTLLTQYSN